MIETLVFLIVQLIINMLFRFLPIRERTKYIFACFAPLTFSVLMLIYPMWSINVWDFFYPPNPHVEFRCGNEYLGAMSFEWLIGTPLIYFGQRLLNRLLFKNIIICGDNTSQNKT